MRIAIFLLSGVLAALVMSSKGTTLSLKFSAMSTFNTGTTQIPHDTTSQVPLPTSSPFVPDRKGETNVFNVTDSKGKICILFKGLIQFNFVYKNVHDLSRNSTGTLYLPSEAMGTTVSGSCDDSSTHQIMNLTFYGWNFELLFVRNETQKKYHLDQLRLEYNFQNGTYPFPDAEPTETQVAEMKVIDDFVPELSSFVCYSQRTLVPKMKSEFGLQDMKLANEQYEAFVSLDDAFFSTSRLRCKEDKISNLVPIAVGVSLAILIVIVVVAYLIGRHRSRKGYEAV